MEKIILEEILNEFIPYEGNYRHYNEDDVLKVVKEACFQTLKLAAKKAKINKLIFDEFEMKYVKVPDDYPAESYEVDKQSILNVKDLIE